MRAPVFEGETAALDVAISEGPVFRLSELVVEGAVAWSADQVAAVAGVTAGAVYTAGLAEVVRT